MKSKTPCAEPDFPVGQARVEAIARAMSPGSYWDDPLYDPAWGWKEDAKIKASVALAADPLTPVAVLMANALREVKCHLYTVQDVARAKDAVSTALATYEKLAGTQSKSSPSTETDIDWNEGGRVHNWKNHVGENTRAIWSTLNGVQRQAIREDAEYQASREEWE